jgi:multidrug efflux system outer membrane protein
MRERTTPRPRARACAAAATGAFALTALLAGCAGITPEQARSTYALPERLPSAVAAPATLPDEWWTLFGDPAIDALVEEGLANAPDVALAAARVAEARAGAREARADRLPTVSVQGDASRSRASDATLVPGQPAGVFEVYAAKGVAQFELDLWGRYAAADSAARQRLLAQEWNQRAVRLSLAGDIVRGVVDLRTTTAQLAVARRALEDRLEADRIQRVRFAAGAIAELDRRRSEADVEAARVTARRLELDVERATRRLATLLGRPPAAFDDPRLLADVGAAPLPAAPLVPADLPAKVLERRPDVRAAEAGLIAAGYDVWSARTSLLPGISLTGSAGSESFELANLFASGTNTWSAAAQLIAPVFSGGRARVRGAEARREQRLQEYRGTVLGAFRDVYDSLRGQGAARDSAAALAKQAVALRRAVELADLRYREGDYAFLDLLDARRSLLQAELDELDARRSELDAAVNAIVALGG